MLYFSLLHLYGTNDWGMEVIIMREMLSVILNGCEGSVAVVQKACYPLFLCAKFNSFISYAKIKIKEYPIRSRMR